MKGYVLASKYLIDNRMRVGYMYREMPNGSDSGWRFFVGSETEEYLNDPAHIGVFDIGTILTLDPSVEPYLKAEPGVAFSRVTGLNRFSAEKLPKREDENAFGYVFATKMLVSNRLPVLYMYREQGKDGDSGWRFFCGEEDQEYVDDTDNIEIYDIKTILAIDDSILPYLNAAPGTAYERNSAREPFRVIEDFSFEPEDNDK